MPASTTGSMIVHSEPNNTPVFSDSLRWSRVDTLWKPPDPSPDAIIRPRCVRLLTGRVKSIAAKRASTPSVAAPYSATSFQRTRQPSSNVAVTA